MTVRKAFLSILFVVLVMLGFWLGSYYYFINSDDWYYAKKTISSSEKIISVVGPVKEISLSPFGFSYGFRGDRWALATFKGYVLGDKGEKKFKAELEKSKGKWKLLMIEYSTAKEKMIKKGSVIKKGSEPL